MPPPPKAPAAAGWWRHARSAAAAGVVAAALVYAANVSYLLFHSLVELFAIVTGVLVGVVAWYTYRFSRNHFLTFLGLAYPWVAAVDLVHTLAYKGMGVFPGADGNLPTQLWLVARLLEAGALALAPWFLTHPLPRAGRITAVAGSLALLLVASVFGGIFPTAYVEGAGLTGFKIATEYVIVAILAGAGVLLWRQRHHLDRTIAALVAGAWALTVVGELAFTFYVGVYDLSNMVGHLCKLGSFWLVFVGLVRTSLTEPFRLLSRDSTTYDAIPEEILVVDRTGRVRQINRVLKEQLGRAADAVIGQDCHARFHPPHLARDACPVCRAISNGEALSGAELALGDRWQLVSLSPIRGGAAAQGLVHVARDITQRKRAEEELQKANRAMRAISASNQTLVRVRDERRLLQEVCRIVVEKGGYCMAWVGFADDDAQRHIVPVSYAGREQGYLSEVTFSWADGPLGMAPAGTALRTGHMALVNSIASDVSYTPWRGAALRRGYSAAMAFPLVAEDKLPIGVLVIYSDRPDAFTGEETQILSELASDLAFGIGSIRDQRARRTAEENLRLRTAALDAASNGAIVLDAADEAATPVYVNPAVTAITGWPADSFLAPEPPSPTIQNMLRAIRVGGRGAHLHEGRRRDGGTFWYELQVSELTAGGTRSHWVAIVSDVTERVLYERQLEYQAHFDDLTGLPNRILLNDRLQQAVAGCNRTRESLAVLFLDLDRFKLINDSLGHNAGDGVLAAVAARLSGCLRDVDSVGRYGGDEFVLLLPHLAAAEVVTDVVRRIATALREPIQADGHELHLTASIGAAFYPTDGTNAEELLRSADAAMYRAKESGRDNLQYFTSELNQRALLRLTLEGELHGAIAGDQLLLHYQPQVDLVRRRVIGVEALVRWNHPVRGLIPPDDFIPVAEDSGLIIAVGDWVLNQACLQAAAWSRSGLQLRMAVNVSVRQLQEAEFVDKVRDALVRSELDPGLLELEVTETLIMSDPERMTARLGEVRDLGVMISMDDFGTGYSSLGCLKRLPISKLKIDQSFVSDAVSDPEDAAIIRTVIGIADSLRLEVLAEGVETEAHLRFLERHGCNLIQGFYFSQPLPAERLEQLVAQPGRMAFPEPWTAEARPALLLVDDSTNVLRALYRLLRKDGYEILMASNPQDAFELLATRAIAVIISDQRMPALPGTEFLHRVRELYPSVIRIILSGYTDLQTVTEAVNQGWVYKFLTKPWEDEALSAAVREAFEEYQRGRREPADHLSRPWKHAPLRQHSEAIPRG